MKEYDKDSNGIIEGKELDASPALKKAAPNIDKSGKITAAKLKDRFEAYKSRGLGAVAVICRVNSGNVPLGDATITFEPEACMMGAIPVVVGTTRADGNVADFTVDGKPTPGLACGLYRVRITHASQSIASRFNAQTTLGLEVFAGERSSTQPTMFTVTP